MAPRARTLVLIRAGPFIGPVISKNKRARRAAGARNENPGLRRGYSRGHLRLSALTSQSLLMSEIEERPNLDRRTIANLPILSSAKTRPSDDPHDMLHPHNKTAGAPARMARWLMLPRIPARI